MANDDVQNTTKSNANSTKKKVDCLCFTIIVSIILHKAQARDIGRTLETSDVQPLLKNTVMTDCKIFTAKCYLCVNTHGQLVPL
jgi:hypothetical protein